METLQQGSWLDQPCVIIGGGPSLKQFRWERLKQWHGKSLGLNMAFTHEPDANLVLDWRLLERLDGDTRWLTYGGHKLWLGYEQERKYLASRAMVQRLEATMEWPRSWADGIYRGTNAGVAGLCLAYLLGCNPIYLLGFDLQPTRHGCTENWHNEYRAAGWVGHAGSYANYLEDFGRITPYLAGCTVINLNPASALDLWPRHSPDTIFGEGSMEAHSTPDSWQPEQPATSEGMASLQKFWADSDPATIAKCGICSKPRGDGALALLHQACDLEERLLACVVCPPGKRSGCADDYVQAFTPEEARRIAHRAAVPRRDKQVIQLCGGYNADPKPADVDIRNIVFGGRSAYEPRPASPPAGFEYEQPSSYLAKKLDTLTVVIGETPKDWLPARVLEYTIKKHATCDVKVIRSCDLPTPEAKDPANRQRTGFSFARLAVPAACNYRGRAVYFDSDMLVFADVAELLNMPMPSPVVSPPNITSVLVYDCSRVYWQVDRLVNQLDSGRMEYQDLVALRFTRPGEVSYDLPLEWNMLDRWTGQTKLLHYTNLATQPWTFASHPLRQHWEDALYWAVEDGFITPYDVQREVDAGHCGQWVLQRLNDRLTAPRPI